MNGVAIYRCKLCRASFTVAYDDIEHGFDDLLSTNVLVTEHTCKDGVLGVAELLGCRETKPEVTGAT